jgi:hypothetical protein
MERWLELFGCVCASIAFGWFSPRIVVHEKWSQRSRNLFVATMTGMLFIFLQAFRLTWGESLEDAVGNAVICSWLPFSHCEKQAPAANRDVAAAPAPQAQNKISQPALPLEQTAPLPPTLHAESAGRGKLGAPPPVPEPQRTAPVQAAKPAPPPAQAQAEPPKPRSAERYGVSVVLDGLTETRNRYVATLRIVNANTSDVEIAMLAMHVGTAEFFLTDENGGSCQMAANGEGWGSLNSVVVTAFRPGHAYSLIPANSEARHFIYFNKGRCPVKLTAYSGISMNGTFLLSGGASVPVSFSNLTMKAQ